MFFRVIAQLPEEKISSKYREMWVASEAIVSFYDFSEDLKEHTCIRLKDGNVVITESSVLNDLKKSLISSGIKYVSLGGRQ